MSIYYLHLYNFVNLKHKMSYFVSYLTKNDCFEKKKRLFIQLSINNNVG